MFNYTSQMIGELWPNVTEIRIETHQVYRSAFGVLTDGEHGTHGLFKPDSTANFHFKCINRDCTMEFFDLHNAVSSTIEHHQEHVTGTLECRGKEAKDHPLNRCPCTLDYDITIEYRKDTDEE